MADTSLPASRSYTVKKRKQGDHRKGVGWGIPVLSHPPSPPFVAGFEEAPWRTSEKQASSPALLAPSLDTAHPQRIPPNL